MKKALTLSLALLLVLALFTGCQKADVHHTYIGQLERSEKTPRLRAFQKSPERWVSLFPVSLKISASSSRKIISPHSAMLCCRNSL